MQRELLIIDRKDTTLEASSGRLTVRIANQKPVNVPLHSLERIIIATPVEMGSQVLNHLATHQVAVVFLANYYKHEACWLTSISHGNHERKLIQYEACTNKEQSLKIAQSIVRQKLIGQRKNLIRWQSQFPKARAQVQQSLTTLKNALLRAPNTNNLNSLLGIEGSAASIYFGVIAVMLAESYQFQGRNRRPPKDPINASLSLAYTLAQQEAESAITAYGLDPGLGFLHAPSYGRASLGCDLVELVRPELDAWVITLFNQQTLTPEHFYYQEQACLLGKAGRAHFFNAWATKRQKIKRKFHKIIRKALNNIS